LIRGCLPKENFRWSGFSEENWIYRKVFTTEGTEKKVLVRFGVLEEL
jgi:hypothetical protein